MSEFGPTSFLKMNKVKMLIKKKYKKRKRKNKVKGKEKGKKEKEEGKESALCLSTTIVFTCWGKEQYMDNSGKHR